MSKGIAINVCHAKYVPKIATFGMLQTETANID
jgi:hypothetical protein